MLVVNDLYPTQDWQLETLRQPGPPGPIVMVNLLKFRAKAEYADGRASDLTGRDAYLVYAYEVSKLVVEFGGQVMFSGAVSFLMLGQVEDLWDEVALAQYPNRGALLAMAMSPKMQEIGVHRAAGLLGQLNIETVPSMLPKL